MTARKASAPRGRPPRLKTTEAFADDVVEELLARIALGETLTAICADRRMPGRSTVYDWEEEDVEFAGRLQRARVRGVHALVESCIPISEEPPQDAVHVADKRVRIDLKLRLAGKWLPLIYGDRVDVNHSGEVTTHHDLSKYSDADLGQLEALVAKHSEPEADSSGEGPSRTDRVH